MVKTQKNIPPDSVLLGTESVRYNHRPTNETSINTITPSKSIKLDTSLETTIQKKYFLFSPNIVATRTDHVYNPIYADHTVTTTKQPEATDDST